MTTSLVGQAGPDQRPASRRRRESSEGRLGPLLNQQPTATISPNPTDHLGGPRLASLVVCPANNRQLIGMISCMSKPVPALVVTDGQREVLELLARSQSGAHREVVRAKALLMAADGAANTAIARSLSVSAASVKSWRDR